MLRIKGLHWSWHLLGVLALVLFVGALVQFRTHLVGAAAPTQVSLAPPPGGPGSGTGGGGEEGGQAKHNKRLQAAKPRSARKRAVAPALALTGNWVQLFPANTPPSTDAFAMAADPVRKNVLLWAPTSCCPATAGPGSGSTWIWNGSNWLLQSPAHVPPARSKPGLAFNPSSQSVIMFGGRDDTNGPLNDTWSWNGTDWTRIVTTTSPSPRHAVAMATFAKGILLMGGNVSTDTENCKSRGAPNLCASGETWVFVSNGPNTGNWQLLSTGGPSPRVLAGMADLPTVASPGPLPVGPFNPVLFGGALRRDPATGLGDHGFSAETWIPNSVNPGAFSWVFQAPANGVTLEGSGLGPPPRCVVVFAPTVKPVPGIILFSGRADRRHNRQNTWLYQAGGGGSWTQLQDENGPGTVPGSLNCDDAASAQDPTTGTPIFFNDSGETWRWGP